MSMESVDTDFFVDSDRMQTIENACESFQEVPPELSELANGNEALIYIAQGIHSICSGNNNIKFTVNDRKTLEFAIRTFAFQANNGKNNEENEREQNNTITQLTKQLSDSKEELFTVEKELEKLKDQNRSLQKRLESSAEENKEYFDHLTQSETKITNIRRENSQIQNKLKNEIEELKDEILEMKDKVKMSEYSAKRLKSSLDSTIEELSAAQSELVELKSKAKSRAQKAKSATSAAHKMQLRLQEVESENQNLLYEQNNLVEQLKSVQEELLSASPENVKKLEEENDKYKDIVDSLQSFTTKQSEDIVKMRQEQKEATDLLRQQINLANAYDARYETLSADYENAVTQNEALNRTIEALTAQVEELKEKTIGALQARDITEIGEDELDENEEEYNKELAEQNKRLIGIIENQLRFLQSAVVKQVLDMSILSPDALSNPLIMDLPIRERLLVEISRIRQFISLNELGNTEMKDKDVKNEVAKINDPENIKQREAFAVIALQAENNEIIRMFCDKVNSKYKSIIAQLNTVADIINYEGETEDLGIVIAEKFRAFQTFAKKAQIITKEEFDPTNYDESLSKILEYLRTSSCFLRQCNTDLRSAVRFEGELIDLPFFTVECVNDLLRMIAISKEENLADTRAQIEQLELAQEEEKEKAAEAIAELESDNKQKEDIINELQNQLEESEKKNVEMANENRDISVQCQEAEEKLQKVLANYNEVEADMEAAKEETERIREQMNKKQKSFEQRLNTMMAEERQQHADDIKHIESKSKTREDKLKNEISVKSARLREAKAKLREVIETYDSAFRQQKETTSVLRQQNQELIERLQHRHEQKKRDKERDIQIAEVEQLKADLKQIASEKTMLENKLEQTIANAEEERNIRESYWESQLMQKDEAITRSIQIDQDESEAKVKDFVTKVARAMYPYITEDAEADSVIEEAENMSRKLTETQSELQKIKTKKMSHPSNLLRNSEMQRIQKLSNALQEWDRWGRDLYVSVTEGDIPTQSTKDLRYQLGEMVLASIGHRQIIWRLECLRSQKKALTCGVEIPNKKKEEKPLTGCALSNCIIAAIRIMRKSGYFQTLFD